MKSSASGQTLREVDWSTLPPPQDDGGAAHLAGLHVASVRLPATDGLHVDLATLSGTTVLYIYPMTGRPDVALPEGWDGIPGARGCTPQSCAFRDHYGDFMARGVDNLFGLSTQSTDDQREAAARLHLPYPLLSDADHAFRTAMTLPIFDAGGVQCLKRMTLILRDGVVVQTFYPVFPPDRNAAEVIAWLDGPPGKT